MKRLHPIAYPIAERVTAFSTTRHGGISTGNYASMNITHYCGDAMEAVKENRRRLSSWLGIDEKRIVLPRQTHQTEVRLIDETNYRSTDFLEGVDALVTTTPDICIGISTADCIPIIIYDRARHAAAAIHAGWRGTVARIAQKTIRQMEQWCGSNPESLHAVIGPGISLEAFEVGDEVFDAFRQAGFQMDSLAKRFPASDVTENTSSERGINENTSSERYFKEKWHIDLPECNRQQLTACGIPADNIHLSRICTYTDCHTFFSARRLGIHSGRIFTGIMLHP